MSKVTDMTKEELLSSLGEHIKEVVFRYKDVWENYENLDEENKELKQEILKSTETYDLGFEEGFAKGEESMQEKVDKIIDYWVNNPSILTQWFGSETTLFRLLEKTKQTCERIEYEKKKERYEKEIHIGDVVTKDGFNYVVFGVYGEDNTLDLVTKHGVMVSLHKDLVTKTGKHYPIDEMIKELGQ